MAKLIRYLCIVGPQGHAWADIAHAYLQSLLELEVGVRVLPIGGGQIGTSRWPGALFVGDLAPNYINVVCTPFGRRTGRPVTGSALAPASVVGMGGGQVPARITAAGAKASAEVVYDPELAIAGLLTAGKRNIAILCPGGAPPSRVELEALKSYAMVITTSEKYAEGLGLLDVVASAVSPAELLNNVNEVRSAFLGASV